MRKLVTNVINYISDNDKNANAVYEWDEIIFKSAVFGFSVYLLVVVDMMIYGYITR